MAGRSRVEGRTKAGWSRNEGAIVTVLVLHVRVLNEPVVQLEVPARVQLSPPQTQLVLAGQRMGAIDTVINLEAPEAQATSIEDNTGLSSKQC